MRILFVDQFGELGGAQQCLLDLLPAVLDRDWRPFAAVPDGDLATRLRASGVPVEILDPGSYSSGSKTVADTFRYMRTMPGIARQLGASIGRNRIDLLYVNGPRLLPAAAMAGDVARVFHAHNYLPPGLSRELALSTLRMRNTPVIAVSHYVAGYLRGALPPERIALVPNGVADAWRPPNRGNIPRIGIIGRIAPEKGHLDFVEAAKLLPRDWQFLVCGASVLASPGYEKTVRHNAEGLPIEFLGWTDDIAAVLATLDLLVVPSGAHEALGRVVLEAFSAEVPVVAYPSGGIPELIHDGQTGFLVDDQNPSALAAKIRLVMADEAGRRRVARNARHRWTSGYTLDHYRDGVTQIMARAASTHNNPAASSTGG